MGRITDHVRAVVDSDLAMRATAADRAPRSDWGRWPVSLGLLAAIVGASGAIVAAVQDVDQRGRGYAAEAAANHDRSATSHLDLRARLERCEERSMRYADELRERVAALETRLRMYAPLRLRAPNP